MNPAPPVTNNRMPDLYPNQDHEFDEMQISMKHSPNLGTSGFKRIIAGHAQ